MPFNPTTRPRVWKDDCYFRAACSLVDSINHSQLDPAKQARAPLSLPSAEPVSLQEATERNNLERQHLERQALERRQAETHRLKARRLDTLQNGLACSPRVLLVEDDEDNLFYAECAVEEFGCEFVSTTLGSMALPLALAYQPNIILLDIWLREMTGFEVLRHLQQHSQTMHIPAIAVTALSTRREANQIAVAGFAGYLVKPYMLEDLGELLALHQPSSAQPYELMDIAEAS